MEAKCDAVKLKPPEEVGLTLSHKMLTFLAYNTINIMGDI